MGWISNPLSDVASTRPLNSDDMHWHGWMPMNKYLQKIKSKRGFIGERALRQREGKKQLSRLQVAEEARHEDAYSAEG